MGFNKVMLIGYAAKKGEPQVKDGRRGTEFPLVVERSFRNAEGQDRTLRSEIPIVGFGALADVCASVPESPKEIYVEGRLKMSSWKTEDGKWHYSSYVIADRCEFEGAPPGLPPPWLAEKRAREAQQREMAGASAA